MIRGGGGGPCVAILSLADCVWSPLPADKRPRLLFLFETRGGGGFLLRCRFAWLLVAFKMEGLTVEFRRLALWLLAGLGCPSCRAWRRSVFDGGRVVLVTAPRVCRLSFRRREGRSPVPRETVLYHFA